MSLVKKVDDSIINLRNKLNHLIDEGSSLLDPNVILASQLLDTVINEYYSCQTTDNRD